MALSALCASCGSPTPPTTPPTTLPGTPPSGQAFLHVRQGDSVVGYEIDWLQGTLERVGSQHVEGIHRLTGDPRGHFAYVSFGPRSCYDALPSPSKDARLEVLAPDARGRLEVVSVEHHDPFCGQVGGESGWLVLTAGAAHLDAVWATSSHHLYKTYVTRSVGESGQLGPERQLGMPWGDDASTSVAGEADSGRLYEALWGGRLVAYSTAEATGEVRQAASRETCGDRPMRASFPMVAAAGRLVARAELASGEAMLCAYGPLLTPGDRVAFRAQAAAAFPQTSDGRPLVAVSGFDPDVSPVASELRLYALGEQGQLELLDRARRPERASALAFDPTGRMLFASGAEGTLSAYGVVAGHLQQTHSVAGGAGRVGTDFGNAESTLAVTVRPPLSAAR